MTNEDATTPKYWAERQMAAAERAFNRGDIDDKEYDALIDRIIAEANAATQYRLDRSSPIL